MDNYFWPLMVTISASLIIGIVTLISKNREQKRKTENKLKNKPIIPQLIFKSNKVGKLELLDDNNDTKFILIRQLIQKNKKEWVDIKITGNNELNKVKNINKIENEVEKNKQVEKISELKDKIKLLLIKEIHPTINKNIKKIIENLSAKQSNAFVSINSDKIVFVKKENPKIDFWVHLDFSEMKKIAKNNNIEYGELINEIRFTDNYSISLFYDEILCEKIIPTFIERIYELQKNYNFDIKTKNWEKLYTYEIGIG